MDILIDDGGHIDSMLVIEKRSREKPYDMKAGNRKTPDYSEQKVRTIKKILGKLKPRR